MTPIYLDNNSTTRLLPEVADVIHAAYRAGYGNPASQHALGREARRILEDAREGISQILDAEVRHSATDSLFFTSGGTESNNLAIRGLAGKLPGQILISAVEHPSIARLADRLTAEGWQVDRLEVDKAGVVKIDHLRTMIGEQTRLVSVMLANNETGVLQPVRQIVEACSALGIPVHTDATQMVGKLPVSFRELGVSALTFAAHKFHGPHGIGGLLLRHGCPIEPMLYGGFQQSSIRPGTEPVVLAHGMKCALEIVTDDSEASVRQVRSLRDRLEDRLRDGFAGLVVLGADAERLPNTSALAFPGIDRQALVLALDLAGVACSTGAACASGSSERSPTLEAMGCSEELIRSAIRLSCGRFNTVSEIDSASKRILKVCNDLRGPKTG